MGLSIDGLVGGLGGSLGSWLGGSVVSRLISRRTTEKTEISDLLRLACELQAGSNLMPGS